MAKHSSNETIFQGAVPLLEHFSSLVIGSPSPKVNVVTLSKRHGIPKPAGRSAD